MTTALFEGKIDRAWQPSDRIGDPLPFDQPLRFCRTPYVAYANENGKVTAINLGWKVHEPEDPAAASVILGLLDERERTAQEIADQCDLSEDKIQDLLEAFHTLGIVQVTSNHALPAETCYEHGVSVAKMAGILAGVADVKHRLVHETPHSRAKLGALVEEYHYIHHVASHVAAAIQVAQTPRQATILSEYLAEEYWHDTWVARGLGVAGLTDEVLAMAQPLPPTLALINFLRWTAQSDLLSYCICMGLAEARPEDLPNVDAEFSALRDSALPEAVYRPFHEHAREDAVCDHSSRFLEAFLDAGTVSLRQRQRIHDASWQFGHAHRAFYQGILDFYGAPEGPPVFTF